MHYYCNIKYAQTLSRTLGFDFFGSKQNSHFHFQYLFLCPHFQILAIILHISSSLFLSPIPISPSSFYHLHSPIPAIKSMFSHFHILFPHSLFFHFRCPNSRSPIFRSFIPCSPILVCSFPSTFHLSSSFFVFFLVEAHSLFVLSPYNAKHIRSACV